MWEVEYTDEFGSWWNTLTEDEQERVTVAVGVLEQMGPALGRPWVDTLEHSRHANMKELRPRGGHLRVLFAFDPRRTAILLVGGDKTNEWSAWYERAIPEADDSTTNTSLNSAKKEPTHEPQDQEVPRPHRPALRQPEATSPHRG